ncbi:hypothetical protein C8E03_11936 [Lachnotalea glycerini]|uniref:Uncharacterized protein n=1 Tax=Lachnotalea glycerini TaxID=1763509 RepID=A0A318EM62_9FIRM|nr:hypothetical protein [Lachnotalea glycerini]PXV85112.1 hypothetical protein C8E03_11936 [Lachnotalea glycerini]
MLQVEKEHKRTTLISSKKEDLVNQIMHLEHNNNVLHDTINQQVENYKMMEKNIIKKLQERIASAEKVIVKESCDKLDEIANDTAEAFISAYQDAIEIIKETS